MEIQLVDGKFTGTMRPFLGGDDGATITEATIVGGNSAIKIAFVFRNDGLKMAGTDVQMGDVPWTTFKYDLAKKRTRY